MPLDLVSEPLNQRVTKEIRAEMARQRISQTALAEYLGRNQTYVSYRLTGKTPLTLTEVEEFADALRVQVDRLLLLDEAPISRRRRAS
jgi:transcriptional regulator with XRE-family HTH domain